ncbi:hypothetical protein [Streptomyces sp. NPDC000851]
MSNLFVVAYNDLATAEQVRQKLFDLSKQHLVELEDAVVVERREDADRMGEPPPPVRVRGLGDR